MKANDDIPADEMLLAEAIAAAMSRGLEWTKTKPFRNSAGEMCGPDKARSCCALGALVLSGRAKWEQQKLDDPRGTVAGLRTRHVWMGNDDSTFWLRSTWSINDDDDLDDGESLGWAFRCAMTQEEP